MRFKVVNCFWWKVGQAMSRINRKSEGALGQGSDDEVVEASVGISAGGPISGSTPMEGGEEELIDEGDIVFHFSAEVQSLLIESELAVDPDADASVLFAGSVD